MNPIKHKPTRYFSVISILSVATFAIVIALATMIATGGGRDRALEQRWYGLLASGNPQILGTFRTENLQVDQASNLGAVGTSSNVGVGVTNINGPTRQTVTIPGGAYDFGELNLSTISGTVPDFPHDLFVSVIRNTGSADTTAHTSHSGGIAVEVTGTRTAGGNDLTNTAFECEATGGQVNECIHILAGDFAFDGGGAITQNSGTAFFGGSFLAATGEIIAEYNGGPLGALYFSADPGPTNTVYSNAADPSWNAHHVTKSVFTLWNDSGPFWLKLNAGGGLDGILSPNGVPVLNHGTPSPGSTDWIGDVTGVGANNTVVMTYTSAFPTRSRCHATSLSSGQQVVAVGVAASVTFTCFTMTTGAAANCNDFTYTCVGQ